MDTLLSTFRTTTHVLSLSLADLTDAVARTRTRGSEGPSITWLVGHLLEGRVNALALLGSPRPNPWSHQFSAAHSATDGADYPSIQSMQDEWGRLHAQLESALAEATPEQFARLLPNPGLHGESSVLHQLAFIAWHESYHVGVVGAARVAAGLEGPAVLAQRAAVAA